MKKQRCAIADSFWLAYMVHQKRSLYHILGFSASWESESLLTRRVLSSTTSPQSSPLQSPGAMPAAGDLSTVLRPLGGKRGLVLDEGDACTGDAGQPAKRPRSVVEGPRVDSALALRLFAFKDWTSCVVRDDMGNIPLHCAVLMRDLNRTKRQCCVLNACGHSLDVCNKDGETPLHLAVIHRMADVVDTLIKFGARPQYRDASGNTAFHLAVQRDAHSPEILKYLLDAPDISLCDVELYNDDGYTPLHLCAMYDKADELNTLISRGADVNIKDAKSGRTPLFHAVEANSGACCRALLSNGANASEQNFAGHTPIIAASEFANGHIQSVLPLQTLKMVPEDVVIQLERGRRI